MDATGIIFAGLDCDADSIEEWNRWYDLEHVPPNVSMPGVMLGRRYVATPELHACRIVETTSGFADGRGTFLTIYTLCGDPANAFDDMTVLRDKLYAGNRMTFPAAKKAVREGDVFSLSWALADPARSCLPADVPFVGHTCVIAVERRSDHSVAAWYRDVRAPRIVELDGVHGIISLESATRDGLTLDMIFVEGDPVRQTEAVRAAAPHHDDVALVLDAPFSLIDPLRYGFAQAIRASSLPATVA